MTKYPAQIDDASTLPSVVDNTTPISANTVNRVKDAVIAIESELGVKPSGVNGTVKARLDSIESSISAISVLSLSGDVTGPPTNNKIEKLSGRPLSSLAPGLNQVLTWNGIAWTPATVSGGGGGSSVVFSGDLTGNDAAQSVIGIQGNSVSSVMPLPNQALCWDGAEWAPTTLSTSSVTFSGDLSGNSYSQTVVGLQGKAVSNIAPGANQVLTWNGLEWEPATPSSGGGGAPTNAQYITLATDASLTNERVLTAGTNISFADGGAGGALTINNTYTYTLPNATAAVTGGIRLTGDLSGSATTPTVSRLNGISVSGSPTIGQVLTATSTTAAAWSTPSGTTPDATATVKGVIQLAGDLSGTSAAPVVSRLNGITVTGTPTAGQMLIASSGTAAAWSAITPATSTVTGGVRLTGDLSGTATAPVVSRVNGVSFSGAPTAGQFLTATSATTASWTTVTANDATNASKGIIQLAGDLSGTADAPTVVKLRSRNISSTAPANNQALVWNSAASEWTPTDQSGSFTAGGDLSGTALSQIVVGIQGKYVNDMPPSDGDVLVYSSTNSEWYPSAVASGFTASGDLSGSSTSQMVTRITGSSGNVNFNCSSMTNTSQTNVWWNQTTTARITTSNATPTTIATISTAVNNFATIDIIIIGKRSDATQAACFKRAVCVRNNAGVLTFVGTVVDGGTYRDDASWNVNLAISGTTIIVSATGVAATNIYWTTTYSLMRVV